MNPQARGVKWWAAELEKRTGGKVKVELYFGASLFGMHQTYDSIVGGVADMANYVPATAYKRWPVIHVTSNVGVYFPTTMEGTMAGVKAVKALYDEFPEVSLKRQILQL